MCNLYGLRARRWELLAYYRADETFRREADAALGLACAYPSQLIAIA